MRRDRARGEPRPPPSALQSYNQQNYMLEQEPQQPLLPEAPLMPCHPWESQYCSEKILSQLFEGAWRQAKISRLSSQLLNPYSNMRTMSSIQEVNNFLSNAVWIADRVVQEKEPVPLLIDSLLPISAEIDAENGYKKGLTKRGSEVETMELSKLRVREEGTVGKEKYLKLQITEVSEEDGFTKELRKQEEEKNVKKESEKKISEKKEQLRMEKLKEAKKGQKEQKFCYDYNGETLQVKLQNKANLVSKIIQGQTQVQTKIVKQINKNPQAEPVSPSGKKDKKLLLNVARKKDEVQFSEVRSLADNLRANTGIKYTYEGKTYEEKQRVIPPAELRKTLSERRISKEEYRKVRGLNGNKEDYQEHFKKSASQFEQVQPKRVRSQAKHASSRLVSLKKEKIHVSSNELKGKLLQKQAQPQRLKEERESKDSQAAPASQLGNIDNFNLQYLRTGGTLASKTSIEFHTQRSNRQFPKIVHTTLYSKLPPKNRERIKDGNELIRDLRKRFQEKLRL